jgi:hypothetical protein
MPRMPSIQGVIRRRLLVNFRVDAEVIQRQLPAGFSPKLQRGSAIAGICLIRLEQIRPGLVGWQVGMSSENAAHRVAVVRTDAEKGPSEGVYIPQRHTNSWLVLALGGRLFPGQHRRARFQVTEGEWGIDLSMQSTDGSTGVRVAARDANSLPADSAFPSLETASTFFRNGAIGFSATSDPRRLEALKLEARHWKVAPLDVKDVYSSWFADEERFPRGSVEFDCALIMRDVAHRWLGEPDLYVEPPVAQGPVRAGA